MISVWRAIGGLRSGLEIKSQTYLSYIWNLQNFLIWIVEQSISWFQTPNTLFGSPCTSCIGNELFFNCLWKDVFALLNFENKMILCWQRCLSVLVGEIRLNINIIDQDIKSTQNSGINIYPIKNMTLKIIWLQKG